MLTFSNLISLQCNQPLYNQDVVELFIAAGMDIPQKYFEVQYIEITFGVNMLFKMRQPFIISFPYHSTLHVWTGFTEVQREKYQTH